MNNLSKLSGVVVLAAAVSFLSGCESNGELGGGGGGGPADTTNTLTITVSGNGTVVSSSGNCPANSTCSLPVEEGTVVTLFAVAGDGAVLRAWSGGCSVSSTDPNQCVATLDADKAVVAVFDAEVIGGIGDTFAVTASGKLLSFDRDAPGTILTNTVIKLANGSDLPDGDEIVAISYRPASANAALYALAMTSTSTIARLYTISESTAAATQVAQITTADDAAFTGPGFGIFFDPGTVLNSDLTRLRIVDSAGKLYEVNAADGSVLSVNDIAPGTSAIAGTNAFVGTGKRTLYTIGGTSLSTLTLDADGAFQTQNSAATLASTVPSGNGFDVDAVNGSAYVAHSGSSGPVLRTINLATGATIATADIGDATVDAEQIVGLAIPTPDQPQVFGICGGVARASLYPYDNCPDNPGRTLVRFNASTPGTITEVAVVSGLAGSVNETVVALDVRPSTNVIYALTLDPGDPAGAGGAPAVGRLYTVNTVTGLMTPVSTTPAIALVINRAYGLDIDPVTEIAHIIGGQADGLAASIDNIEIDLGTGALTVEAAPQLDDFAITSVAFNNNNAFSANSDNAPHYYGIDSASNRLFEIERSYDDNLFTPGQITFIADLPVTELAVGGFEILSAGQPPSSNVAYMTRSTTSASFLYRISLTTGDVDPIGGAIGSDIISEPVVGLTAEVNAGDATDMFVATTGTSPTPIRLIGFLGANPGTTDDPVPETPTFNRVITGLEGGDGERVVALDFGLVAAVNRLYLLTKDDGDLGRLYTVNLTDVPPLLIAGEASLVGELMQGPDPYAMVGTNFGMDVDPENGQIRITSDAHINIAVDPATGNVTNSADLNQSPLPIINALAFTRNFTGSATSELLMLDINVGDDKVARFSAAPTIVRSVDTGFNNSGSEPASWDILGGHDGISLVTEQVCDNDPLPCPPSPAEPRPNTVVWFLDTATDTAEEVGTVGTDETPIPEDSRILLRAMTARFPD